MSDDLRRWFESLEAMPGESDPQAAELKEVA